jgi:2-polyprenyl-6-methoxyphenol hydroxylase-like FAD-dependent oxidoreductase
MKVVINGVGVAGPTLAYWLRKAGHQVMLVEKAQQLRLGGYVVDRHGHRRGGFPVDIFGSFTHGRFTSLRRSDLAATIYAALDGEVETIYGDSIARIEDDGRSVRVGFRHAASREFDLVVWR